MELFTVSDVASPADDELPSYSDPGRVLFWIRPVPNEEPEVDFIDYDGDKATFWLHEGSFGDYTVRDIVDIELEGFYVLEGVTGHVSRSWDGEYDEEWSFEFLRRASESEIKAEALE
jgi:hypothetical protein